MFLSIHMSKEQREKQQGPLRKEMARRAALLTPEEQKAIAQEGARRGEEAVRRLHESRRLAEERARPLLDTKCDC
jgi:hypothetical protein